MKILVHELFEESGSHNFTLVGLGGTGKTQLALHLAYWAKQKFPEYSIFWLPAMTVDHFKQECTKLVGELGIQKADNESAEMLLKKHLMSEESGSWLLIVDNADDDNIFGQIFRFIPESDNGRLLYTTRSQAIAVDASKTSYLRLSEMRQNEADQLLGKTPKDELSTSDDGQRRELLENLGYLPLAIAQASSYMSKKQVSVEKYLKLLRSTDSATIKLLEEKIRDVTHYDAKQGAVLTTWMITFEQIERDEPAAADLLLFMSCLEANAIPSLLLPKFETEESMISAIGTLCGYGMLTKRENGQEFDMHSLVHLTINAWAEHKNDLDETKHRVVQHLISTFPYLSWGVQERLWMYLPHVVKALFMCQQNEKGYILAWAVIAYTRKHVSSRHVVKLLNFAIAKWKELLAEDVTWKRRLQIELAMSHLKLGNIDMSMSLLEGEVLVWNHPLKEADMELLKAQHALAAAYSAANRPQEALDLQERVVAVANETFDPYDLRKIIFHYHLVVYYRKTGNVEKAIELAKELTREKPRSFIQGIHQLGFQDKLGEMYIRNGKEDEAWIFI